MVGKTAGVTERVRAPSCRDHVFLNTENTSLNHDSGLDHALMRCCCCPVRIKTSTPGSDGRPGEHVDLHSLRRTFATSVIYNGVAPASLQELLGHRTLKLTMQIRSGIPAQIKLQTSGQDPCGLGIAPDPADPVT